MPDQWTKLSRKAQKEEIEYWMKEKPKLEEARRQHGHTAVPFNDNEFDAIVQDLQARFKEPPAPARPLIQQPFHDENLALLLAEYGDEEDQEKTG